MTTTHVTSKRWLAGVAALLSCFRAGGAGGGGCGLEHDAGVDPLLGSFTGTVSLLVGSAGPQTATRTIEVIGSGPGSALVRTSPGAPFSACWIMAEATGCALDVTTDGCFYDDGGLRGGLRLTQGTMTFGAGTLQAEVRWELTPDDGSARRAVSWTFAGSRPAASEASCRAVCEHGRRLDCPRCLAARCESDCEARFSTTVRQRMLATDACRVNYGGDSADQCDAP